MLQGPHLGEVVAVDGDFGVAPRYARSVLGAVEPFGGPEPGDDGEDGASVVGEG